MECIDSDQSAIRIHMFRFVVMQFATAVRPQAALAFISATQFQNGPIDLHPTAAPQTKKRKAIELALRPLRPVLLAWARDGANLVMSHKTAWRIMRPDMS